MSVPEHRAARLTMGNTTDHGRTRVRWEADIPLLTVAPGMPIPDGLSVTFTETGALFRVRFYDGDEMHLITVPIDARGDINTEDATHIVERR